MTRDINIGSTRLIQRFANTGLNSEAPLVDTVNITKAHYTLPVCSRVVSTGVKK